MQGNRSEFTGICAMCFHQKVVVAALPDIAEEDYVCKGCMYVLAKALGFFRRAGYVMGKATQVPMAVITDEVNQKAEVLLGRGEGFPPKPPKQGGKAV